MVFGMGITDKKKFSANGIAPKMNTNLGEKLIGNKIFFINEKMESAPIPPNIIPTKNIALLDATVRKYRMI